MTPEEYYGDFFTRLKYGEEYLKILIEKYPVNKTDDGIQPILYVKSRIKTPQSTINKLEKRGFPTDKDTALSKIYDTIGIRIVCSFEEEVYNISKWLYQRREIHIIEEKDYIAYPKANGYRSLHLILQFTQGELKDLTAEIQIRSIAIDFWAVLEHQLKYKQDVPHEDIIKKELKRCADEIASIDLSMQTIRELLRNDTWNGY